MLNHRYYTNNMGLEAPLHGPALLTVPEVINFARCIERTKHKYHDTKTSRYDIYIYITI